MALGIAYAKGSTQESGAAEWTGLATVTPIQAFPGCLTDGLLANPATTPQTCKERHDMRIFVMASSDQAFNLNYLFTTDGGTTWRIGDQIASTTVIVDGGKAGAVNSAILEIHVGYQFKVEIWNTSGSTSTGGFEYRYST
jgi:hypothetical protein